ncbi:MAG: GNAT family N-acetyltransferase [Actinomycetota bacterium]|nr:GNAT family N-acetyltransferase [Actinomycetota bacterium]
MAIEFRKTADEDEVVEAFRTIMVAFGEDVEERDVERARKTMPADRVHVAVDDGKFVGVAAAYEFALTIPGGEVPAAGVTWVAVLPTHRRQGVATGLMRHQFDEFRERGEPLAILWSAEAPIYGRFGYGIAAPVHDMNAQKAGFAFRDDPGLVGATRLVTRDEATELFPPVYERVRTTRPGMLSRSTVHWYEERLYDGPGPPGTSPRFFVVFELDGVPEGYATYRPRDKWDDGIPNGAVFVVEALGASLVATREIWRYLFGIDLRERVECHYLDPALTLYLGVLDPRRLRLKLSDGLWLRFVDLEAALRARAWGADDSLVLEVRDTFCPWNDGRYRTDGTKSDADADLVLTAADLASAYLGGIDVSALAAAGRVAEQTPGAVARAAAMFRTPLPPFCPEVF